MRRVRFALAAPALWLCTLPGADPAPQFGRGALPIGGGPPGGVQVDGRSTPTSYGDCGPGGKAEAGMQGQVTPAEQGSEGARCNLRLVGENDVSKRGANFQMGWYKQCAYVGSVGARDAQTSEGDELDGVAVLDASDPGRPELVKIVRAPSGVSQHEAVEVNEKRGMLVVETGGLAARYVDIYDVSKDCRDPVFKARYDAGQPMFHGMRISPDGNTVYATDFTGAYSAFGGIMHVIDVSDMSKPELITRWDPNQEPNAKVYGVHDLEVSPDGRRLYLGAVDPTATPGALVAGPPSNSGPTMVVLDVSEVQDRKPDPDLKVVSDSVRLPNFGHAEQRATIGGKPYIFTSGETPFVGADNCPWAWGNVIDISDEAAPKVVSEIRLEVNEPGNCGTVGQDDAVYSIHYVGVDDPDDTTMVFYTFYTGGVRVFDVRDPANPKEIAYYHPTPVESVVHQPLPKFAGDYQSPQWDSATSDIRYFPETRQLWFVSIGRGFQVLELQNPVPSPATGAGLRGRARVLRQSRRSIVRRGSVRVRARCNAACRLTLRPRVAGRRAGRARSVRFGAAGRRVVRVRLNREGVRILRKSSRARVRVIGTVRAPDGTVAGRFKSPWRRPA